MRIRMEAFHQSRNPTQYYRDWKKKENTVPKRNDHKGLLNGKGPVYVVSGTLDNRPLRGNSIERLHRKIKLSVLATESMLTLRDYLQPLLTIQSLRTLHS